MAIRMKEKGNEEPVNFWKERNADYRLMHQKNDVIVSKLGSHLSCVPRPRWVAPLRFSLQGWIFLLDKFKFYRIAEENDLEFCGLSQGKNH